MLTHIKNKGFTLVELSIVLVIIGILVGLGAGMMGPLTTMVKVRETKDIEDANLQTIISWASSNNKIPIWPFPASFTDPDKVTYKNDLLAAVVKSPQDPWNHIFTYLYFDPLYNKTPSKDTICGRSSTSISLKLDNSTTINNVAFAILSGADNVNTGTAENPVYTSSTFPAFINNACPSGVNCLITVLDPINATPQTGRDIVKWITLDELRNKIGCQGAPLKIANTELPVASASNGYDIKILADGGVPLDSPGNYNWCYSVDPSGGLSFTAPAGVILKSSVAECMAITESAPTSYGNPTPYLRIKLDPVTILTGAVYQITVVLRDNADGNLTSGITCSDPSLLKDNCVKKVFTISVNP